MSDEQILDPHAPDLLLVFLIRAADQHAMSQVRITVLLDGTMISGTVIGIDEYRRRIVQSFAEASPTEAHEKMMRNTFEDVLGGMEVIQSHVEWLHLSECVTCLLYTSPSPRD